MRIVGGTLSGRKIEPPLSLVTRPMMDRVREALFNILAHRDWGKNIGELFEAPTRVLDAFCGTGALALEALSWGVGHATLFDKDIQAIRIAKQNALSLGLSEKCHIEITDVAQPPSLIGEPSNLIFLAPPYRKGLIPIAYKALDAAQWIAPHAVIVAETAKNEKFDTLDKCILIQSRSYGDTSLHFLSR